MTNTAKDIPTALNESAFQNDIQVIPDASKALYDRDVHEGFRLIIPRQWKSSLTINPFAAQVESLILDWFGHLGCSSAEIHRASKFDAAGYVGIPFPNLSSESTIRIGKYLSLWLLWDDIHIESLKNRWKIRKEHLQTGNKPKYMSRFDEGWWELLSDYNGRRSQEWISMLCEEMITWSNAANYEANLINNMQTHGIVPSFSHQLEIRIATIGMYATVLLLEDDYDYELPLAFHQHPTTKQLKKLSNKIVGLGNDIFSFGKDLAEGHLNLASTLMQENGISTKEALSKLIHMHNLSLVHFDKLASIIETGWGEENDHYISRWIQDVRYASLGFSLWESQAPRYTSHKVVINNKYIEPYFDYH